MRIAPRNSVFNYGHANGEESDQTHARRFAQEEKLCLNHHDLLDVGIQGDFIAKQKVLAGHFIWGEADG